MANVNMKDTTEKIKQQAQQKQQQGNQVQQRNNVPAAKQGDTFKAFMRKADVQNRIEEVLKTKATQFQTTLISIVANDTNLRDAEPTSVLSSAMKAAVLDLPIEPNFGYAWIIARKDNNRGGMKFAQFQLGYKGYIQLALRSNQYKYINVIEVYEGELVAWNRLTEEFVFDESAKASDVVIGYAAYFELKNGFKKTVYWSKEKVESHKAKFSKSDFGWKKDWDAMAKKTVLTALLRGWGILSVDLQQAIIAEDEAEEIERIEINPEFMNQDEEQGA